MTDETMTPTNTGDTTDSEHSAGANASKKDMDTADAFPLLDLPPEIWSRICKLAVIHDGDILLKENVGNKHYQDRVYQPSITRVCKLVREETLSSFYSQNRFMVQDDGHSVYALRTWLQAMDSGKHQDLKQLYILSTMGDVPDIVEELRGKGWSMIVRSSEPPVIHYDYEGAPAADRGLKYHIVADTKPEEACKDS